MKRRTVHEKIESAYNYALNFYTTNSRSIEDQQTCLAEMVKMTGFEYTTCIKIQDPILFYLRAQYTMDIANEAIQHHLNIASANIRNQLLSIQDTIQPNLLNELPYIPQVPNKPVTINSLEQTMQVQSKGSGSYDFSNQKMGYQGVDQLLYGKSHIYLRGGDVYQGALAKKYTVVTKLNLANCDIGSLGGGAITSALYNTNNSLVSLVHLDLSNNDMCDVITYPFGKYYCPCPSPSLRIIDLSNNKITDNGAASLSRAFEHNRLYYLNHLNLSGNELTEDGINDIGSALAKTSSTALRQLDLYDNKPIDSFSDFTPMINGIKAFKGHIIVVLAKVKDGFTMGGTLLSGSKEAKQALVQDVLQKAQTNGVDIHNVAVSKGIYEGIINFSKVYKNLIVGFVKCNIIPDDVSTFAVDEIVARVSKKAHVMSAAKDATLCFFDTVEEVAKSPEGVQFIKDVDLVGANELIDSME